MEEVLFRAKGYVLSWKRDLGFGFIKITHVEDEGEFFEDHQKGDAFAHYKNIQGMKGYKALFENQIVEFDVIKNGRTDDGEIKFAAKEIHLISSSLPLKGEIHGNR